MAAAPGGSNWGNFGADDQLGRLNLVTKRSSISAQMESPVSRPAELELFSPVQPGAISLSRRVVHAPTTRLRADPRDAFWGSAARKYIDVPVLGPATV